MFSDPANPSLSAAADGASSGVTSASPRDQAIARSLEAPRARSVERLERFLAAARDLANEQGSASFTVAQVTAQAGLSLKSFYRCFAGKDDLLVGLLEHDSRLGAAILGAQVAAHDDAVARVRAYLVGVFELLTHPGALGYARMLVQEHRRLTEERPEELRVALAPMVDLLTAQIAGAAELGVASSVDPERDAQTLFVLVLEGVHEVGLGRVEPLDQADYLWGFAAGGLGIDPQHISRSDR